MPIEIPKGMGKDARDFYERVAAQINEAGTLTPAAALLLERVARTWGRIRECERYLDEAGWTMEVGENGYQQKRPEVGYIEVDRKWMLEAMQELKVTPASSGATREAAKPVDRMRSKLSAAKTKAISKARETVQ